MCVIKTVGKCRITCVIAIIVETSKLGHGLTYKYAHNYPNGYVKQQYLPDPLIHAEYYKGVDRGVEHNLLKDWNDRRKDK